MDKDKIPADVLAEVVHRIIQAVHPEQILLFGRARPMTPNNASRASAWRKR